MENSKLYNLNMERGVLSAILFEPILLDEIGSKLESSHFYLPNHAHIWDAMQTLHRSQKPIDEEFLRVVLQKKNNYIESVLLEIMSANPISNRDAYIEALVGYRQKRNMINLSMQIRKEIENDISAEELIANTTTKLEEIAKGGVLKLKKIPIETIVAEKPEFWCKDWLPIPVGVATMISGIGGTGKGWLALQLALRLAKEGKKVYLWFSEDVAPLVKDRYDAIKKEILIGDYYNELIDITDEPPVFLLDIDGYSAKISDKFYGVKRELNEYDVILFDPLLAFYGGDENGNSQARVFMQPFMDWAKANRKAIVFLHHSKKDGGGFRGAGAFMDAMRSGYEVETHTIKMNGKDIPDPSKLHLKRITLLKDNYGASLHIKHQVDRHLTPAKSAKAFEVVYEDEGGGSPLPDDNSVLSTENLLDLPIL